MIRIPLFVALLLFALTGCPSGEAPPPTTIPGPAAGGSGGGLHLPGGTGGTPAPGGSGGSGGTPAGGAGGSAPAGGSGGAGTPSTASARFFLPTDEPTNTSAPTVELDGQGNMHLVYPAYFGGGAYYATCGKDCAGPAAVKAVRLPTEGTVGNAMLALD